MAIARSTTFIRLALGCACGALFSCGQGEEEPESAAAAPVGPPAAVMAEIAAWQAVGGKIALRDLAAKPATPGTRNAADLHKPLIDLMKGIPMSDIELIGDPWGSSASSLEYVLETYEKELATLKEALALPSCNWQTPSEEGQEVLVPHLSYARTMARLLVCEARVRTEAGDFDAAAESILNILRLSEQVANEPLSISVLVAGALDAFAIEAIERFLEKSERIPASLLESLKTRRPRTRLREAFLCEGTMMISTFVELAGGSPTTPIAEQSMSEPVAQGLVWTLATIRLFVEQSDRPLWQKTDEAEARPKPSSAMLPEMPFGMSFDAGTFARLSSTSASFENNLSLAITALQLREHKAKHGEYPDPRTFKTPEDVFTGRPIEYVRGASGFTLVAERAGLTGQRDQYVWEW